MLPALGLLSHRTRIIPPSKDSPSTAPAADLVLLDARTDIALMRDLSLQWAARAPHLPVIAVLTEGGLVTVTAEWAVTDIVLDSAGPAELEARIRLALARIGADERAGRITAGALLIDEDAYAAKVDGVSLDLTYKEFELLRHLAQYPGRVFTRAQLLQEVWGYDYFGGTRTVDVHVRRLRAKLGPEHEGLIGTVRNVGYLFHDERSPQAGQ